MHSQADSPLRILVADDDLSGIGVLTAMLIEDGHQVIEVSNGAKAVKAFKQHPIDVVLLDVEMPVLDGIEAARQIKALPQPSHLYVPILFLTAHNKESVLERCLDVGADHFITKPYSAPLIRALFHGIKRQLTLGRRLQVQNEELSRQRHRQENERQVARQLFGRITRDDDSSAPNLRYHISPVSLFNGDVLFVLDRPTGSQHIMLGDFAGHGLPAALGAIPAAEIFYAMTKRGFDITEIATELNKKLVSVLPEEQYCAAVLMEIDFESSMVRVWNGGIPEVVVLGQDGILRESLSSVHLPLGIIEAAQFNNQVESAGFVEGDRIYAATDGVRDTIDKNGERFGRQRFLQALSNQSQPSERFDQLLHALHQFSGEQNCVDDLTLIEIKCYSDGGLRPLERSSQGEKEGPLELKETNAWSASYTYDAKTLQRFNPVPPLVNYIIELQGLHSQGQHIHVMMTELFSNALEHGLLNLNSSIKEEPDGFTRYYNERATRLAALKTGEIKFNIICDEVMGGGVLQLSVSDSGSGFDIIAFKKRLSTANEPGLLASGRGLVLVNSLCKEIDFAEGGSKVIAVYEWTNAETTHT